MAFLHDKTTLLDHLHCFLLPLRTLLPRFFLPGFRNAEGFAHFFAGVWAKPSALRNPGKKKRSSPPPRQSLGGGKKMPKAEGLLSNAILQIAKMQ
jgi:hypothetical protein